MFNELPSKIGEMLDERASCTRGGLTVEQIVRAVDQSSQLSGMSKDVAIVKQSMNMHVQQERGDSEAGRRAARTARFMREFKHGDDDYKQVPRTWTFPTLGLLQPLYLYWHAEDEEKCYPPMKFLEGRDVAHIGKRAHTTLCEIRRVMTLIDDRVKSKGRRIKTVMTPAEANSLYSYGEEAVLEIVPAETKT